MPIDFPIFQPQVQPGNMVRLPPSDDFSDSAIKGYQVGRMIAGVPQQLDALKIAQQQKALEQSGQEFPTRLGLMQEELKTAPVARQLAILQGITSAAPGFVNPGEPGSTMPMYPSEGVTGGPSMDTLRTAAPTGAVGVPAADIQQRRIQDLNAQTPSDTIPLNFPGMAPIPYSPSKEAQYKMLQLTAPFRRLDYEDEIAQRKEARIRKPTNMVSADPETWGQPIVRNDRGEEFLGDSNEPFSGKRQTAALGAYVDPKALEGALKDYKNFGRVPAFGMGQSAMRSQFFARLGDPNVDLSNEAAVNKAERQGLQTAFSNQSKIYAGTEVAVKTLDKQLNLAEQLSNKVDRTGVPVFNRWLNAGRREITGDSDVTQFHNAVKTASREYAKIIGGSAASITGSLAGDEKAAEDMINDGLTKGTFSDVKGLMTKEGNFRLGSNKEELGSLVDRMKEIGADIPKPQGTSSQSAQQALKPNFTYRDKSGKTYTTDAQGHIIGE